MGETTRRVGGGM